MAHDVKALLRRSKLLSELIGWVLDEQSVRRHVAQVALEDLRSRDLAAPPSANGHVAAPDIAVPTAANLRQAIQILSGAASDEADVGGASDCPTAAVTTALGRVQEYGQLREAVKPIVAAAATLHTVLDVHRTNARPARHPVRFIFAGSGTRGRVDAAVHLLAGLLDDPDTVALHEQLRTIADTFSQPERTAGQIWREFEQNSATVISAVEDLLGAGFAGPASTNGP